MSKTFLDKNNNTLATVYETSEVVANPTLEGTEASLNGLKIGSTKYKVEGGSGIPKYIHYIEAEFTDGCDESHTGVIILENETSTQLSVSDFKGLFTKQYDSNLYEYIIPVVTSQYYKTYRFFPCAFVYDSQGDYFLASTENNTDTLSLSSIIDTVVQSGVSGGGSSETPTFYLHRLQLVLLDGCETQYKVFISYIDTSSYSISSLTDLKNFVFNNQLISGKIMNPDKPCSQFFVEEDESNWQTKAAIPCCLILNSNDTFGDTMASHILGYSSELTLQSVSDHVTAYE